MVDLHQIREVVRPFADGRGVPDWQARAVRLRALAGAGEASDATALGYDFDYGVLPEPERARFGRTFHQVESVERLAMSAVAHALYRLAPPDSVAVALCGVFYDEALHLQSLSALQGLEPCAEPWIAARREPFWRLLRETEELLPFVLFQHCLSEAEGCIAGAEKLRQLQQAGAGEVASQVAHRISVEETSHALTGYTLLAELDRAGRAGHAGHAIDERTFRQLIARYLEVEPLVDAALPKGKRQRFALRIAERYLAERDLAQVRAEILGATRAALAGEPI